MNDDLTTQLTRELHEQVDGWHGDPLTLESVRGRAHSIRRTRRLAAAGATALAVAAIVVPTALLATGAERSTSEPADPTSQVVRTTLTLDGLERGAAPGVEYFTPDGVVLPGEGTRELPYHYNALVPSEADGGWIGWEGAALDVRYLDEELRPQGGSASNDSFVSNPDRTAVAWVSPEPGAQTLVLHSTVAADGDRTWDFPDAAAGVVDPVDLLADDRVVFTTTNSRSGVAEVGVAEPDGSTTALQGYVDAVSASPETGLVAVQTESRDSGKGCFGVVDPAAASEPVWETCDHALGAFSPDGSYLLASDSSQSGAGPASVRVLDATTGDEVARFDAERGQQVLLQRIVWETDDTFLAVAAQGNDIAALRFGVDGSLEQVTDRVTGDAYGDLPFYFGSDRVRGF